MGKYYAVANGRSNGVYNNWSDCKQQVDGYSGAKFKSFATKAEANAFANGGSSRSSSGYSAGGYGGGEWTVGSYSPNGYSGSSYSGSSHSGSSHSGRSSGGGGSGGRSNSRGSQKSKQIVYTDGSALSNGRSSARAGWGVYWGNEDSRNQSGKVSSGEQTNNRGELEAIDKAVHGIAKDAVASGTRSYEIRADSQYARDSLGKWADNWERNGWKTSTGGTVKNQDLIQSTRQNIEHLKQHGVNVDIAYVQAHVGHEGNEAADQLARNAANS